MGLQKRLQISMVFYNIIPRKLNDQNDAAGSYKTKSNRTIVEYTTLNKFDKFTITQLLY